LTREHKPDGSNGELGMDTHDASSLRARYLGKNIRDEWEEVLEGITRRSKHEYTDPGLLEVLLELEALIGSEEYVIARFGSSP
jgi:hypothetical protein